ncbi:MAG: hypothetical protein U5L04_15910 [Trueperaceae bacterium]|nr:hypothetical protein [Trueperaceae bacterium]
MRLLSDDTVRNRLDWPRVLAALEAGFRTIDDFTVPERVVMAGVGGSSHLTMPCNDAEGWFGVKQVAVVPDNAARDKPTVQAHYTLFAPDGTPTLSLAATVLTRLRTAAASAVAARYLASETPQTLLVVGTGSLAPWLAEAHLQVRPYQHVIVWGRDPDKARACAADIEARFAAAKVRPSITTADVLGDAVSEADVISVATTATEPIVRGNALQPGQHLDLVGAFNADMAEADPTAVRRSRVFVDTMAGCRAEAGDLIQAAQHGWSFDDVQGTLSDIVRGDVTREADDLTLFKSVGTALEDLVVARLLV